MRKSSSMLTSDKAIVVLRRMMLDAIRLVERGETPPGLDPRSYRNIRPYDAIIAGDKPWQETFAGELQARW